MTTHRRFFALLLLLATATPDSWVQAHVQGAAQASEAVSAVEFPVTKVMEALREMLDEYQSTPFPGLPTINVDQGEISLSVSLSDIYLEGLNNFEPKPFIGGTLSEPRVGFYLDFKKISFLVGSYTSSGHILNLPFNGEGPMHIHLHNLLAGLSFGVSVNPPCAIGNTTDIDLDLIRMEYHMENLNKGTDQGQVVNIVVSSFGQDIVERLEVLFEDRFYDVLDGLIVGTINNITNCTLTPLEDMPEPDDLIDVLGDIVRDFLP